MKKELLTVAALFALLVWTGCASAGGGGADIPRGPSDQELVTNLLTDMLSSLREHDIDSMAMHYSEDFQSNQGQDKTATVEFLKGVKEQGFLEGMEVNHDNLAVTVEGETASAEGVEVSGAFGVLALSFKLEKRDGTWLVTYQAQE